MNKRYIITGLSGVGKSTLIKSINEFPTHNEYMDDHHVTFWYKEAEKGESTDHNSKNVMLFTRLSKLVAQFDSQQETAIYDRGLIDLMVASELRIKPRDEELHNWFIKKIESVLLKNKPTLMIYLDVNWEEFKARIYSRGRNSEVKHLNQDETWYRNYFNSYKDTFLKYANKYEISYKIVDVSNNNPEDTKKEILSLIG